MLYRVVCCDCCHLVLITCFTGVSQTLAGRPDFVGGLRFLYSLDVFISLRMCDIVIALGCVDNAYIIITFLAVFRI